MKSSEVLRIFQAEVNRLDDKLGLKSWDIRVKLKPLETCYALCDTDVTYRVAQIQVSTVKKYESKATVKRVARHEVAHILDAELAECAYDRFTTADQILKAREALATVLEKIL